MPPTDKPEPSLTDRLADLQSQRARLGGVQAQLEQQIAVVREQGLRCEGAIQIVQILIDERAKAGAVPEAAKP